VRGVEILGRRHEISENDWKRVKDLLPPENAGEGRPSKPNRIMLNGMLRQAKTGASWHDLPEYYGPWQTIYSRSRKLPNFDAFRDFVEMTYKVLHFEFSNTS
jgi:transposase